MIRIGIAAALLSAAPALADELACRAGGVPADAVELREATINVAGWGEGNQATAYASFLIPADWKDEGSVILDVADPCGVTEKPRWRAAAPDGSMSIEVTPGDGWTASADRAQFSACPSRDIHHAAGYAEALLMTAAPGAVVQAVRDRPDIANPIEEQMKFPDGFGATLQVSAAEADFTQPDGDGAVHGLVVAAIAMVTPDMMIPEYERRVTALPSLLARSRKGPPDPALVEMVRASALPNPNWLRLRERIFAPPGRLRDPRDKITKNLERLPFPEREAGNPVAACGRRFAPLRASNVWRSEDGRTWFSPELTGALETTR